MELVDRALVARVIEHETARHSLIRGAKSRLAHEARITRSTLDGALNPEKWEKTSPATWRSIERALGLPPFAFDAVKAHAWSSLEDDGVPLELIAWMQREVAKREQGNPDTAIPTAL